jgi:hypothetical protein
LVILKRLSETYQHKGEGAFLDLLQERSNFAEIDSVLDNVRYTAKKFGAQEALEKITRMLIIAGERQALVGGGGPDN